MSKGRDNSKFLLGIITLTSLIFVFNIAYADEALDDTISIENKTATLSGEPTGISIITYGMFNAEDDGNLVHQLLVGETYWFNIVYQNESETIPDIRIFMQMIDKNKTEDNVLRKIDGHGYLKPSEMMGDGFEWIPEYTGHFKITTALIALDDPLVGGIAHPYDFVVIEGTSLKQQLKNTTPINDIICRQENHHLVERANEKLACVYLDTAEKLGWKIHPNNFELEVNQNIFSVGDSPIISGFEPEKEFIRIRVFHEDDQMTNQKIQIIDNGFFGYDFKIQSNWPSGMYYVFVEGTPLDTRVYFTVEP